MKGRRFKWGGAAQCGASRISAKGGPPLLAGDRASAGLAAAFNAPMAGILFAIKELHINVPDSAFFAAMISCVAADLLTRSFLGQTPVLHATLVDGPPPLDSLLFFVALGIVAGIASWAFNRSIVLAARYLSFGLPRSTPAKSRQPESCSLGQDGMTRRCSAEVWN